MRNRHPSHRPPAGPLGHLLAAALILLLGGCRLIGGGSSPSPGLKTPEPGGVQGVIYQGSMVLEGGEITGALEIIREGRRGIRGALQTSTGLVADGDGDLRGQTLSLELLYGGDCPGRMALEGNWDERNGRYEGAIQASDCTGKASGTFRFSSG